MCLMPWFTFKHHPFDSDTTQESIRYLVDDSSSWESDTSPKTSSETADLRDPSFIIPLGGKWAWIDFESDSEQAGGSFKQGRLMEKQEDNRIADTLCFAPAPLSSSSTPPRPTKSTGRPTGSREWSSIYPLDTPSPWKSHTNQRLGATPPFLPSHPLNLTPRRRPIPDLDFHPFFVSSPSSSPSKYSPSKSPPSHSSPSKSIVSLHSPLKKNRAGVKAVVDRQLGVTTRGDSPGHQGVVRKRSLLDGRGDVYLEEEPWVIVNPKNGEGGGGDVDHLGWGWYAHCTGSNNKAMAKAPSAGIPASSTDAGFWPTVGNIIFDAATKSSPKHKCFDPSIHFRTKHIHRTRESAYDTWDRLQPLQRLSVTSSFDRSSTDGQSEIAELFDSVLQTWMDVQMINSGRSQDKTSP
ncbi:hypothetical protein P7C70_g3684, partial [Phenoliferia sp. Uapishka_3]